MQFYRRIGQVFLASMVLAIGGCALAPPVRPDPLAKALQRLVEAPRDPTVYLQLVELSLDRQDYVRASQYLTLAEQSPLAQMQPETLFRHGLTIAIRSQNFSRAIRRCQDQLQRSESLAVRRLLAALFEVRGDAREAERQHLLIHEIYPTEVTQLAEAARFYERSTLPERLARARALYERYLHALPSGPESVQARAALLIIRHDSRSQPPGATRR